MVLLVRAVDFVLRAPHMRGKSPKEPAVAERPKTLIVCVNRRYDSLKPSCAVRGSLDIIKAIEAGISRRGIDIAVERKCCLGQCERGPAMRVAPGGEFFLHVSQDDVERILERLETLCGTVEAVGPEPEPLPASGT